jgi:hypothetical protein
LPVSSFIFGAIFYLTPFFLRHPQDVARPLRSVSPATVTYFPQSQRQRQHTSPFIRRGDFFITDKWPYLCPISSIVFARDINARALFGWCQPVFSPLRAHPHDFVFPLRSPYTLITLSVPHSQRQSQCALLSGTSAAFSNTNHLP